MYKQIFILALLIGAVISQPAGTLPGIQNGYLILSSTTDYNAEHSVFNSKLNRPVRAWCPATSVINNNGEWIMASSITPFDVYGIQIQGRYDYDQWVTSFQIQVSLDGFAWTTIGTYNSGLTDRNTVKYIDFGGARRVRNVLLKPVTWNPNGIAVRWEVNMKFV
ncbi:galactose-binding domain-containing protein [Heterostelium album PN500]|uniref:Galactose-binding domain-containing protein n=1 Tax=Heterostelium pallidum (strain ATCC 26659 / Pp 5 / PN500) TaxID=670386 RepID=D3B7T6_HETP5|nr:galactose-binding domain-containing protein [Heterostelium album PN500]EFA82829.1 galactose-binding domain-containing protein [Heterostelium album PN500]|eukprot:XP_020434946.1 galactose-binding domain-containing protein [Heterostelium album PN500]